MLTDSSFSHNKISTESSKINEKKHFSFLIALILSYFSKRFFFWKNFYLFKIFKLRKYLANSMIKYRTNLCWTFMSLLIICWMLTHTSHCLNVVIFGWKSLKSSRNLIYRERICIELMFMGDCMRAFQQRRGLGEW